MDKTMIKLLLSVMVSLTAVLTFGCTMTVKSDPETEKAIEGTWECSQTEYEDGISMTFTFRETYSLPDHRSSTTATIYVGYPVNERMLTMTYSGEWRASKDVLANHVDEKSVDLSWNRNLLDASDVREMEDEMLSELKKNGYRESLELLTPITDTFEARDDDGERYRYKRVAGGM